MRRDLASACVGRSLHWGLLVGVILVGVACDPAEDQVSAETCSRADRCSDGRVCVDGQCVEACNDESCPEGAFCDDDSGVCVQCRDNTDCQDGEVCNAFTNTCTTEVAGCSGDGDCDRGVCDVARGACVDCLADDDCGDGQTCNALTRSCETPQGCTSDFSCAGSGATPVCEPNSRTCVQCYLDTQCDSGACDAISRTCLTACVDDDPTEPNAAVEGGQPGPITSGGEHSGEICPGDIDELTFSGQGRIEATLVGEGGALTLTLLNAQGTVLGSGPTSITVASAPAGTFRLRVQGQSPTTRSSYLLRLTVTPPAVCTEVDTEPNNTPAQAGTVPTTGALRSGTICGADVDVWTFPAGAGDGVTVTLTSGNGAGTPTFTIEGTGGTVLASGTAQTPAQLASAPGGALFVRVRATGGDVDYSLRATTTAAPPQCVQTDAEPNNDAAQAAVLVAGTTVSGQICAADVDQWRIAAAALDDVTVILTGTSVRARLFDAGGAVLGEGTGTFTVTNVAAGVYRVEVRGALSTTEAAYSLRVNLVAEPTPDPCVEGGVEPDAFVTPRAIATDGTNVAGRICADDTDFFRFTVVGTQIVRISARFIDADGDLDLRLKDSTGATITSAAGVTDEELIIRSLDAGSYVVEVFGFDDAENTYSLAITTAGPCTDDGFEPNDSASRATPTGPRPITATRCSGNDDLYAITLGAGDTFTATLTTPPGSGELSLALLNKTGGFLQSDVADGAARRLEVSSLAADRYLIRVTGNGIAGVDYTLTPTITPTTPRCLDDGAELNDTAENAFAIDAGVLADGSYDLSTLVMCDASLNRDVFVVDVPGNRTFRVALDHAASSDLDVEVFELRGTEGLTRSLARGIAISSLDVVQGSVNTASRLFIRVTEFGTMPAAGLPYSLGLELGELDTNACVDDRFDSWTSTTSGGVRRHTNDALTDPDSSDDLLLVPTQVSPGESLPSLQICSGTKDFFSVSLTEGQRFQVDVTYDHFDEGDVDLRVFGPDNSNSPADNDNQVDLLACSTCSGVDGNERFVGTAPVSGTYFIEVFGFLDSENAYDLDVTLP